VHQYIGPALRRRNKAFCSFNTKRTAVILYFKPRPAYSPTPGNTKWADAKNFLGPPSYEEGKPVFDRANSRWLTATLGDAKIGRVSARVTAKVGATQTYEQLVATAKNARTENAARKSFADNRLAGKVADRNDVTRFFAAKKRAESVVYCEQKNRRWPPSPYHIEERTLARRYGVALRLFERWRSERGLPPPITDFGQYAKPRENWWHVSAIAEWDRSRSKRDWSTLTIEREKRKYTPQTTTRCIYFRGPVDLVSDEARARNKNIDDQKIRRRQRIGLLSGDEEIELIRRAKCGDLEARNKIIVAFLPIIERLAREAHKSRPSVPVDDLIHAGIIGFVSEKTGKVAGGIQYAIDNFDQNKNYKFSTFCRRPIKWAFIHHLKQDHGHVPLSGDNRESENVVDDLMHDEEAPFNEEFYTDARSELAAKLVALNHRERFIFETRHGLNGGASKTLGEIGSELKISRERVRQIETKINKKIGLVQKP
jgi:RNA polymerase sigma factor (sigma-70 family)